MIIKSSEVVTMYLKVDGITRRIGVCNKYSFTRQLNKRNEFVETSKWKSESVNNSQYFSGTEINI